MTTAKNSTPAPGTRRFLGWPATRLGRWAVGLAAAFVFMFMINSAVFLELRVEAAWQYTILIFYGIAMLLTGLTAGVVAFIAILRQGERSWLVWLTLLPAVLVLFLTLGEFLVPH